MKTQCYFATSGIRIYTSKEFFMDYNCYCISFNQNLKHYGFTLCARDPHPELVISVEAQKYVFRRVKRFVIEQCETVKNYIKEFFDIDRMPHFERMTITFAEKLISLNPKKITYFQG